ncbi:PHD finger protein 7-like isoform X1 [Gallus gallus]|uniref:PHD finger protein 7-like isoform X1 n=2 Tax=Gallus gallus TaxID=9031 RepID=UPI001AE52794|nr:PHD finger protein 7-like isoform X1 [Gallus gallus]
MMSSRKRKASSSEEPVCALCGRADVDPNVCGHTFFASGIHVHEFCLMFANTISEARPAWVGPEGLPVAVVRRAVRQANQKQCFVCGERGAAITCAESGCERSFHLPCAMDGECVTHFFGPRSSYCWEHRPSQESREAPAEGTNCLICLEPVGDSLSYHTMVCPACAHCWFHRGCIQQQALNAGAWCFRCPSCQDILMFLAEMFLMGIHIPLRRPLWEESDAYESLLERHSRCNACECLYRGGREQAEREGPWQLILCSSCAAQGTHRRCSTLADTADSWECDSCAGLGTASSANMEHAGSSSASREGLRPSHSSSVPGNISSASTSQAASGPSLSSQLPEHSGHPREPETELRPRLHEDQNPSEQRRGRRRSRRTPAPGAESSSQTSTRQRASGSSTESPAAAHTMRLRPRRAGQTRSRSPLRARASHSPNRPRRQRGSRQMPLRESSLPEDRRQSTRQGRSRTQTCSTVGR